MGDDEFKAEVLGELRELRAGQGRVESRMDALNARLNEIETHIDDVNRRVANMEQNLAYVPKNTEVLLDRIRGINQRVDALEHPDGPAGDGR